MHALERNRLIDTITQKRGNKGKSLNALGLSDRGSCSELIATESELYKNPTSEKEPFLSLDMGNTQRSWDFTPRLLLCVILVTAWERVLGQIRYSIPEEMKKGSLVGNVALDLGLDLKELSHRRVRIVSRGKAQHFTLNVYNGHLLINEKIDREQICRSAVHCVLNMEILVEDIMKLYAVEIEIQDVNDNKPVFINDEISLKISESTTPGTQFALPQAQDLDVGINSLLGYQLSANKHFTLDVKTGTDGGKYAALILRNSLDREEQSVHHLILTAADGGEIVLSGTAQINVTVLDANDNAPVFNQSVYKIGVLENVPTGTVVAIITASDIDQGVNSQVTYSFNTVTETASHIYKLDSKTGEISVIGNLDFEEYEVHELEIRGTDGGGLSSLCKVVFEVINLNDNGPEITISSLVNIIEENRPPGTVIALLHVSDQDAGTHGTLSCFIPSNLPFQLNKSFGSYYSLVTDRALDREQVPEYNITITATDKGTPPLSKSKTINLKISDENDNPPVFHQTSYTAYAVENMSPGASIFTARATDLDWEQNAKITYSIIEGRIGKAPISSHISINSESGIIYALRSFDFEQIKEFQIQVKAQDGGSPALASNVTVTFIILDQNDNTPEILYPALPTDGSSGVELAPRSSDPGYLITKVVAVDADSGQNAWLSYQLLRVTDQGLFTVGLHTGEIRTSRLFLDKYALKQFLVVLVKDNGQPPLSSSVTVTIVVAESIPEILSDISSLSVPTDNESNHTLYLVITLAVVSFLFLFAIILVLTLRLHQWRQSMILESSGVNCNVLPSSQFVGIDGVRAFLQTYSGDVCLTTDSLKSQFAFPSSDFPNTFLCDQASEKQGCFLIEEPLSTCKEDEADIQVSCV